jgi:hypothetical protein
VAALSRAPELVAASDDQWDGRREPPSTFALTDEQSVEQGWQRRRRDAVS